MHKLYCYNLRNEKKKIKVLKTRFKKKIIIIIFGVENMYRKI